MTIIFIKDRGNRKAHSLVMVSQISSACKCMYNFQDQIPKGSNETRKLSISVLFTTHSLTALICREQALTQYAEIPLGTH